MLLREYGENQPEEVIDRCRNLLDRGREPLVVLQNLAGFYLNLLIAKTAPNRPDLTAVTETTWQNLCTQAQQWDTSEILRGQQHLKDSEVQLKNTTQPRLWLEVTLLGLLPSVHSISLSTSVSSSVDGEIKGQGDKETRETRGQGGKETRETRGQRDKGDKVVSLNTNSSSSLPTAKMNPPESHPVVTSKHSQTIPSNHQTSSSQNLTSLPSHPVTSSPQQEKEISKELADPVISEPVETISHLSPQELWKKAIDHLQPPTTQALFRQKCHIIALEGSVARVGISTPQLLKLNQGKIPNLEAAFTKACQHTIKVRLEVPTAESQPESSISSSVQLQTPPKSSVSESISTTSVTSSLDSTGASTPEKKTLTPEIKPSEQKIRTNSNSPVEFKPETAKEQREEKDKEQFINLQEDADEMSKQIELSVSESFQFEANLERVDISAETISQNYNSSDFDENLQKAVEILTKNFEGELVTLAGAIDDEAAIIDLQASKLNDSLKQVDSNSFDSDKLEYLSSHELEVNQTISTTKHYVNKESKPVKSSAEPQPIIHNRPDLSQYESEDDVPF